MILHNLADLGFQVRVNGIGITGIGIRAQRDRLWETDLVISHDQLGAFAIDDRFVVELKTQNGSWRSAFVADVKRELHRTLGGPDLSSLPVTPERMEKLDEKLGGLKAQICLPRLSPSPDPVRRALQVLYEAGIPALIDEPRSDASDGAELVVIRVPLLLKSRIRLRRAGFHQDPRWRAVLFDGETGQRIELVESPCIG